MLTAEGVLINGGVRSTGYNRIARSVG
jgi:hypothetical protein